ncbi:MAG: hypothetical protein ACXWC8_12260 [Limisphaerales bacterium]
MKKILVTIAGVICATAICVHAADDSTAPKKHHKMTEEQKAVQKEMLEKYDTNKDGKLDKEEKAKISAEDKEKMKKAGLGGDHKKKNSQ